MTQIKIKICGIKEPRHAITACEEGVDFIGMVFYDKSPRYLTYEQAERIAEIANEYNVATVALTVNADEAQVAEIIEKVKPDYIQFHGDESESDIMNLKTNISGFGIIKAVKIATKEDIEKIAEARRYADIVLLDSKPRSSDDLPGGNARSFDWSLLGGVDLEDCLLAGGLDVDNIGLAVTSCKVFGVDISSGVEKSYGVKCSRKIRSFIRAVNGIGIV